MLGGERGFICKLAQNATEHSLSLGLQTVKVFGGTVQELARISCPELTSICSRIKCRLSTIGQMALQEHSGVFKNVGRNQVIRA